MSRASRKRPRSKSRAIAALIFWLGLLPVVSSDAGSLRTIEHCEALDASAIPAAIASLKIDSADAEVFRNALCRYSLSTRTAIVTYDINTVFENIAARRRPIDEYRFPLPVIVVDGRTVGSLPTHVP